MADVHSDYLVEFVAVAREGSFSRAALELSVSQSALSRHLKALESSLGTTLLVRTQDGVELTEVGRHIYNRAGDIVEAVEDIVYLASQHPGSGTLVVGGMTVFPFVVQGIAGKCVSSGRYTRVKTLPPGSFGDYGITELLDQRRADIYLTLSSDTRLDLLDDGYEVIELLESPAVAMMDASNPLAEKGALDVRNLDGELLLHAQSGYDGERVNWTDTRNFLHNEGVYFRSKTCTLEDESDLFADFRGGMILVPEAYSGVALMRQIGKTIIPIAGMSKTIVGVYRTDDDLGFLATL